jgi:hypothetical protein
MNPWGAVIAGLGVLLVIMGVKGSYVNIESALTGKKHSPAGSNISTSAFVGSTTPPTVTVPNKPSQPPQTVVI